MIMKIHLYSQIQIKAPQLCLNNTMIQLYTTPTQSKIPSNGIYIYDVVITSYRDQKLKDIEALLYQEEKYIGTKYLNQKQKIPFIFCQDKLFSLVQSVRGKVGVKSQFIDEEQSFNQSRQLKVNSKLSGN